MKRTKKLRQKRRERRTGMSSFLFLLGLRDAVLFLGGLGQLRVVVALALLLGALGALRPAQDVLVLGRAARSRGGEETIIL